MTVRRLLAETDSRELTEWQAFYKLEAEHRKDSKDGKTGDVNEDLKRQFGFYGR